MKKSILFLIMIIATLLLVGCGNDGAPKDMQLVSGGKDLGYYFYAPEEWTVANTGEVSTVYVSRIDTTSVTFAKIDPKTFVKADRTKSDESYFFEDYFNDSKAEFPTDTEYSTENGKSCLLGSGETKAKRAASYSFSYTYSDHKFGFLQIFAMHNGNFYILTYASLLEEKLDGVTYFDYYSVSDDEEPSKLDMIIESFVFFTPDNAPEAEVIPATPDADGDVLVSNRKLAGFELYLPQSFEVDYSSAIVSATHADGSNITMTKTTSGGLNVNSYYELRRDELSKIVTDFTLINTNVTAKLGDSKNAASYEYTYVYNGKVFHVYQIFAVNSTKGYVFTYTATEENYSLHLDDINRITNKVLY